MCLKIFNIFRQKKIFRSVISMTYYKSGSFNAICDVCCFKFKANELRKRWDGLMVCDKDFEYDHPQKYLRVHENTHGLPWSRPRPTDEFVGPLCDFWTSSPMADFGTADCAYPGGNTSIERLIELYYPNTSSVAAIAIAGFSITGVI